MRFAPIWIVEDFGIVLYEYDVRRLVTPAQPPSDAEDQVQKAAADEGQQEEGKRSSHGQPFNP